MLFLIEIGGLTITSLQEKIDLKSITSALKTPHPHNVHLTLCIEKSICESSLNAGFDIHDHGHGRVKHNCLSLELDSEGCSLIIKSSLKWLDYLQ